MPYQLVLSELIDKETRKVGENVFFDNLPSDYEVFIFYYPGAMPNEELESKLRNLGDITGKNLFVNLGRLNDPKYKKIRNKYQIKNLPVIIVTAIDKLASPPTEFSTAYVKIDSKRLLKSPNYAIECVQTVFNLFIGGEISKALRQPNRSYLKAIIADALKGMKKFLDERDITVSLMEGKFELRRSGG